MKRGNGECQQEDVHFCINNESLNIIDVFLLEAHILEAKQRSFHVGHKAEFTNSDWPVTNCQFHLIFILLDLFQLICSEIQLKLCINSLISCARKNLGNINDRFVVDFIFVKTHQVSNFSGNLVLRKSEFLRHDIEFQLRSQMASRLKA